MKRGNNNATTPKPVLSNADEDRRLFDAMPKYIRLALIEAKYDYNSQMIWDAFRQMKQDNPGEDDGFIWFLVAQMIPLNDKQWAKEERDGYIQLERDMRAERRDRINQVFLRAS